MTGPEVRSRLSEFVDGGWRETDEFLMVPSGYPGKFSTSIRNGRHVIQGLSHLRNQSNVLYLADVRVGTWQEFKEFDRQFREKTRSRFRHSEQNESTDPLNGAGWQKTEFDRKDFWSFASPYILENLTLGIWNEFSHVCLMRGRIDVDGTEAFRWYRAEANNGFEKINVRSPIRWPRVADSVP